MQDHPTLDQAPIDDLLDIGGPDLVQELTELFFEDTPNLLADIESAADSEDWEALTRASHSLKSSAFYLGALALAELSRQLEGLSKAGDSTSCKQLCQQVPGVYEEARSALKTLQTKLPPA